MNDPRPHKLIPTAPITASPHRRGIEFSKVSQTGLSQLLGLASHIHHAQLPATNSENGRDAATRVLPSLD
jgi:hypothetical protein